MNLPSILLWGFIATFVLTAVVAGAQGLGWSRIDLSYLLGMMVTPDRGRARVAGLVIHLVNGWIFSIVYAWIFESLGRATWWLGLIMGLAHALVVLIVLLPVLPGVHPRMALEEHGPEPTRALEPPGFMGLNYGPRTPLITVAAHLVYGAILGAWYHLAG